MRFEHVRIEGVTCVLPPRAVTSTDIEERLRPVYDRLRLPRGRLESMTGIRERRFWPPGTRVSEAAARAGRSVLEVTGTALDRIGCLIHASVSRDYFEPATASIVHEKLGLSPACMTYDLSNACLGAINGMSMVAHMIELGHIEAGLVVTAELAEELHESTIQECLHTKRFTRADFKRHFATLTIGSGAAAVLLTRDDISKNGHRLLGGAVRTDSSGNTFCREDKESRSPTGGPLMRTDGEALLRAGCRLAQKTWDATKQELDWTNDTPDHIFTHQVGLVQRKMTLNALKLDIDKDFPTVQFTGNTGSAALPAAFALGIEERGIAAGDRVALLGIGSGLCSLMFGVEW